MKDRDRVTQASGRREGEEESRIYPSLSLRRIAGFLHEEKSIRQKAVRK
jgi:hypothetical protein